MPSFAIVNNEYLKILEDGKEGDSETRVECIGFPLRSIPPLLLHHDARRMDMACDDLHNKDSSTTIGLAESRRNRKRSRSTSTLQLDLRTVLPKDLPHDTHPLHTTTSNTPIVTGPDTEVMIHCLSDYESESELDNSSYLLAIHRSGHDIQRLIVSNCAGYWMSDCIGIGAYQQLLLIPKFDEERDTTAGFDTSCDNKRIENTVRGSILTDGKEIWAPRDVQLEIPSTLTLPAHRDLPDNYSKYPRIRLSGHATFDSNYLTTMSSSKGAKMSTTVIDQLPSPWIGTVERALEKRVGEGMKKLADSQNRIRQSRHVLEQGKAVLEELSCTPQVTPLRLLRLKYHSQPNISLTGDAKKQDVSATILLEIDLLHIYHPRDYGSPDTELGLRDVHLHLTAAPSKTSSVNGIGTRSGLVPLLKRNQITTIMVMAELDDISFRADNSVSFSANNSVQEIDAGVAIDVQAFWVDGPDSKSCRCGARLASFTVPFSALLLPSCKPTIIEFALPHAEVEGSHPLGPIYECRKPYLVEIDLSSYRLDQNAWLQEVQESLCGSSFRVENVEGNEGSILLNVALYAFPSSAISGLIQIIKSSLPNNVVVLRKGYATK
jgi:hypothetical protein